MSISFEKFKILLIERRSELEETNRLANDSRAPVQLDQSSVGRVSRIDAMQRQAMAKAGEQRRLNEINRIISALRRIENEEYGDCLECGEQIAEKRLLFDPATPLCIKCATG